MNIEVFVSHPDKLKTLLKYDFPFKSISSLIVDIKKKALHVEEVPFFNVSFNNSNLKLAFVAIENNRIVGLLCTEHSDKLFHKATECYWSMMNIGVSDNHQGRGISRKLIESMFETFEMLGLNGIYQSSYSAEGWDRIMPIFDELSKKHTAVRFVDGKRRFD